jgi:hypothetical protein
MVSMLLLPGDIFGYLALIFIIFTGVFMLGRKRLLRYTRNLELLRKIHILCSLLGGLFLVLHVAYFVTYPITNAVMLGYVSAAVAGVVWVMGTAFLERFKDTLFYHGTLSLASIAMMVIHATSAGINIPISVSYIVLALTSSIMLVKAYEHVGKILKIGSVKRI